MLRDLYKFPVVTNDKGEFSLKAKTGDEWIVVSPPGDFKSKKLFLNGRSDLKIYVSSEDLLTGDDVFTILNTGGEPTKYCCFKF